MNTQKPTQGSQSLFQTSGRDEAHSLDDARRLRRQEQQKRIKLFLRIGLPVIIVILIAMTMLLLPHFRPRRPPAPQVTEDKPESTGNPDARIQMELRLPDLNAMNPMRLELIRSAVYAKPSEVHLRIVIDKEALAGTLTVNGEKEFDLEFDDGDVKRIAFDIMDDMLFRRAMAQLYDSVYGASMHPLEIMTNIEYAATQGGFAPPDEDEDEEEGDAPPQDEPLGPDLLKLPSLDLNN